MPNSRQRLHRICHALSVNLDDWIFRVETIERNATPGNKIRSLALLTEMYRTRAVIQRLLAESEPPQPLTDR